MFEQLHLALDYEPADNSIVKKAATQAVKCGEFLNFDHAYESLWEAFEEEVNDTRTY